MPHREVQDGVLVIFGGALLITPGFLTDILGLLLLIPPTRAVIRRFVMRALTKRAASRVAERGRGRARRLGRRGHRDRGRAASAAPRAVSQPTLSVAFFDPARQVHGLARARGDPALRGHPFAGARRARPPGALRGGLGGGGRQPLRGRLEPASEPVELAGNRIRVCTVTGNVAGTPLEGLGTVSETLRPPAWENLDALRAISVLADPGHALLAVARRPRGVAGPRRGAGERRAGGRGRGEDRRGGPALDRLRRRGPPAQRGPGAVAAR